MKTILFLIVFLSHSAFAIDFNHYHSGEEINSYLREVSAANPDIAKFKILGSSAMGREISYLILTSNNPLKKRAIYINGTHHGDEKVSTEAVLALADYFIKNQNRPEIKNLLETFAIYLQPLVNPDGHFLNRRSDSEWNDLNRDYAYPLRAENDSFKFKETQLIKELTDEVKFEGALAYHAGSTSVLWSWCYTAQPPADVDLFANIAQKMAADLETPFYMQSYNDYATKGEFIDYLYWKYGTIALTVELSDTKTPALEDLGPILDKSILASMSFIDALKNRN